MNRYVIVSSDGHAGADLRDYRQYLPARWHTEFDAWAVAYVNPWGDLVRPDADRNWSHERRARELDADGVAAEILFPNTIPPFFPSASLLAPTEAIGAGMIALAYALYLLVWVVLIVAVSGLCHRSRTALVTLVAVWAGMTIVVPRLAADIASRTAPQFVKLYGSDYDHLARVFEWSTSGEEGEE